MTGRALRLYGEIAIGMTIIAIEFTMGIIELHSSYRMLEIILVPPAVTAIAVRIEFANHFARGMTGAT